jgi:hypothetical protein
VGRAVLHRGADTATERILAELDSLCR